MLKHMDWRAKIGLIVNSGQVITEPRFNQLAPPGVSFHATRMLNPGGGMEGLIQMEKQAYRGIDELATAYIDVLAYCCTMSGALRGLEGDKRFCREVEAKWGIKTTSTMLACVEAMQRLGLRRVVVVSPYQEDHHEAERAYLAKAGIEAVVIRGMGLSGGAQYSAVAPDEIYRFALDAWTDEADGLFMSCMNFDAIAVAQALEDRIGKPVVTSHTATLWRALDLAGVPDPVDGVGSLLVQPRAQAAVTT